MIVITQNGTEEILGKLDALQNAVVVEDILDEAQALLLNRIRARFMRQEAPDGSQWTPSFSAIREGRATLYDTGRLFHSIQAYRVGAGVRAIGTDVPYARKHQLGEDGMLKREFLGFNDEDLYLVEQRILQRIQGAL